MTLSEAYKLLDSASCDASPSAINPNLTKRDVVKIVRDCAATLGQPRDKPCGLEDKVDPLVEKRVWQAVKNQFSPRY